MSRELRNVSACITVIRAGVDPKTNSVRLQADTVVEVKKLMKRTPFAAVICLIGAAITMQLAAQEFSIFTFSEGGDVTQHVGGTKSRFDAGRNFHDVAGVNLGRQ